MTAAFEVFSGVQPWEENQSPSPVETTSNPYETTLALARSRSSGKQPAIDTSNTLQRQLSPDPESPPAAWKRRPSVASRISQGPSPTGPSSTATGVRSARSPSESSYLSSIAPPSRRHPGLMMTNAADVDESIPLPLPQPSFRRRSGYSSSRSSVHSQDLTGMSSEELWKLGQERERDMSNPLRPADERPLDTIKRLSRNVEQSGYHAGLPVEVIWPTSPPEMLLPPVKSKSLTHVPSLARKSTKKRSEKGVSPIVTQPHALAKSSPSTPMVATPDQVYISSAHSSSASLASNAIQPVKSMGALNAMNRPPSTYYSRDFYSSLAPREGGYAIAAMMGNGLGNAGTISAEERRRSMILEDRDVPRNRPARAPMAKSAGMGRWSLDGGEQYSRRPYATSSAATTSSNLSAPPITSPDPSPPLDDNISLSASMSSSLPEGAAPSAMASSSGSPESFLPVPLATTVSNTKAPSPLSQQTVPADISAPPTPLPPRVASIPPPPQTLSHSKSKKQLAKEAKTAEKEAKLAEQARKANQKIADAKAKEDAKRAEKEAKARKKLEDKKAKLKSPSLSKLPFRKDPIPAMPPNAVNNVAAAKTAPSPTASTQPSSTSTPTESSSKPFPSASQSAYKLPTPVNAETRAPRRSMPLEAMGAAPRTSSIPAAASTPRLVSSTGSSVKKSKSRLSFFGTIKKKLTGESTPREQTPAATPARIVEKPSVEPIVEKEEPVVVIGAQDLPNGSPLASIASRDKVLPEPPIGSEEVHKWTTHVPAPEAVPIDGLPAPTEAMDGLKPSPDAMDHSRSPLKRSTSEHPQQTPPEMATLTKSISHDHSVRRARPGSLSGPRPMPIARNSPKPSVASSVDHSSAPTITAPLAPEATLQEPSFHFAHSTDPLTPSTTTGDSSMFSHAISNATSRTSDDIQGGSRKSSLMLENEEARSGSEGPIREDSAETVHASPIPLTA